MTSHREKIVKLYANRIWVESDLQGSRHVMVQSEAPGSKPFCYATFHYHFPYTDNDTTYRAAETLAKALGAQEPVEFRAAVLEGSVEDQAKRFLAEIARAAQEQGLYGS